MDPSADDRRAPEQAVAQDFAEQSVVHNSALTLQFAELRPGQPLDTDQVLQLAVFISKQPRFASIPAEERPALIDNIILRVTDWVGQGRVFSIARTLGPEGSSIVGYLCSKSTGAFQENLLESLVDLAGAGGRPATFYKHFIEPDLPKSQKEGEPIFFWDLDGSPRFLFSYYENNRDPDGHVGILMVAEVDPAMRKVGVSGQVLRNVLERFRGEGRNYVVTFARCAKLAEWEPDRTAATERLQEYVSLRDEKGLHPDYGIRFHQKAGGQIICGIPNCAIDQESHNHMCFVIYDLAALEAKNMIRIQG